MSASLPEAGAIDAGDLSALRRATALRFARRYRFHRVLERVLVALLAVDGVVIAAALLLTLQNPAFASSALPLEALDRVRSSEAAFMLGGSLAIGQMLYAQLRASIAKHEQAMRVLRLLHVNDPHIVEALRLVAQRSGAKPG